MVDRPLSGEPLPLDLVNTRWELAGQSHDALETPEFVATWMQSHGAPPVDDVERATRALSSARSALRTVLSQPSDAADYDAINALLSRGRVRDRIDADGIESIIEVDDKNEWLAWKAAHEFVELLRTQRHRIKPCDGCVLWFLDTTRSGTRRWCSMEACGNRAKVRRHREASA